MPATLPGPILGVVGGGQLGRMLAEAAAPLGVDVVVLDPTPDCPAAPVARDQLVADFDDQAAIRDLAERSDFLTFEIELADQDALNEVSAETGVPCHPKPATLELIHDKLDQKQALADAGIPVPEFRAVETADELREAIDELGTPAMLKARTGGYDGRGNVPVERRDEAADAIEAVAGPAMLEAFVDYEREVSVIAVKGDDEVATFPVGENIHEAEILRETVVPAGSDEAVLEEAEAVARDVLDLMDGRGVYGIELFETRDGEILVNEIAPRPHNSGHWTIEGAVTSQFQQHVRAVLGWPLGATDLRANTVSKNILGTGDDSREAELSGVDSILDEPGASLHWYGKREVRPLRKMGHVTSVATEGESTDDLLTGTRSLVDDLTFR
ncbi:5-(carboxyamino)imidazole ribonucleotide synthase [Haloarchaeobius sp. DT45]|uniref:5-(carboxyamino)imidazole ribonucleotide synthase n=1 Tax=Haloarchaeobius sp. DT45 TaxID=3446116 RepID=UPI003F6D1742